MKSNLTYETNTRVKKTQGSEHPINSTRSKLEMRMFNFIN